MNFMNDNLLEIRERLLNVSLSTIFGQSVVMGANTDLNSTIDMIKSQAKDNFQLVADIIGEETLGMIEAV